MLWLVPILLAAFSCTLSAQTAAGPDLTELSLEDLLNIEVTSVARREQKISQSSSAVYVITQEDIRRSGATTIPDALRMAPGVQVAQIDTNKWAVGIRGFVGRFTSKLLVMIDGRSIYQALGGGVYWEANEVLLDDVERIEVIRGPGATMWGSNAVNGVINIITKHSRDTQGGLLNAGGGNQEGGFGSARLGGSIDPRLHYRFYSTYASRSGQLLASGDRAVDNMVKTQGGFRMDWERSDRDSLFVSGDTYEGDAGDRQRVYFPESVSFGLATARAKFTGANLLMRRTHKHSDRSSSELQVYYDHSIRDDVIARDNRVDIVDAEYQHQFGFSRHLLTTGIGYRLYQDSTPGDSRKKFEPNEWTSHRYNLYVRDEVEILPNKLLLSFGSKLEHNVFSGWEAQPSAGLLWNRTAKDIVWLSAARAARTPSRVNRHIRTPVFVAPGPQGTTILGERQGSEDFGAEYLNAFEAGYRLSPGRRLSLDLTSFYNVYDDLGITAAGTPLVRADMPQFVISPVVFRNREENLVTYGAEAAVTWRALEAAQLRLAYTYLRGGVPTNETAPGTGNRFHAQWFWNLPGRVEWDSSYYYFDGYSGVPSYHRVDSRLGWRPGGRYEFSVVVQNLLDDRHVEAPPILVTPNEIGRSVYGRLSWRF
jgi:iron complex outermembrane receptor protein